MHKSNWTRADMCEAAMRPVMSGKRFWLWIALLSLPVLWAVFAFAYQVTQGLGVTGMSNQIFWGTYSTNLVAFIGYSYGGALVSAILRLSNANWRAPITRIAEGMALVTLLVGAVFALVHIGRPERVWEFFAFPNWTSPLVWDFIAINTYLLATLVFLYLPLIPDLAIAADWMGKKGGRLQRFYRSLAAGWRNLPEQHRLLNRALMYMAILIIPVAVTVHSVLSWAFSLNVRHGWNSSIFGPYFVMAALFSGVAMVIVVVYVFRRIYHLEHFIELKQFKNLGYLLMGLGPFYMYFTFTELLAESYMINEGAESLLTILLLTDYARLFWGVLVLGVIVPTLLIAWPRTRTVGGITVAAALVVVTMWFKRFLIVVPTLALSQMGHGAPAVYTPSWVELSITFGAVFAIPLLLALFFRVFPVLSIAELEEAAEAESPRHAHDTGLLRTATAEEGGYRG